MCHTHTYRRRWTKCYFYLLKPLPTAVSGGDLPTYGGKTKHKVHVRDIYTARMYFTQCLTGSSRPTAKGRALRREITPARGNSPRPPAVALSVLPRNKDGTTPGEHSILWNNTTHTHTHTHTHTISGALLRGAHCRPNYTAPTKRECKTDPNMHPLRCLVNRHGGGEGIHARCQHRRHIMGRPQPPPTAGLDIYYLLKPQQFRRFSSSADSIASADFTSLPSK